MNTSFLQIPVASISHQVIAQLRSSSLIETQRPHAVAARIICEKIGMSTVLADAAKTNFTSAYLRPDGSGSQATLDRFRMLALQWNYEGAMELTRAFLENRLSRYPVLGKPLLSPANAAVMGAVICERPEDREMERHLASFLETLTSPLAQTLEELSSAPSRLPRNREREKGVLDTC
jgi:hypothetical protein